MQQSAMSSPAVVLHEAGYKYTDQRRRVLDVLRDSSDHPTAEDMYARLRSRGERVALGTIYRTLELLERIGLVRRIHLEDRNRYELVGSSSEVKHHYHLVCEKCGRIIDISADMLTAHTECIEELAVEVGQVYSFQVSGHHFRIFGTCRDCQ